MPSHVNRQTVDLSAYPDLVVIYLGMRVRAFRGIKTLFGLGPRIEKAGAGRPEGLLHFENNIIYSLVPLHFGMRRYWRDFESMERLDALRAAPHLVAEFPARFRWHRLLARDVRHARWDGGRLRRYEPATARMLAFAPAVTARCPAFSARPRLRVPGVTPAQPAGLTEMELY